ncbi:MAG TPA: carbohydrate-binding protein, partial [Steroidobacter sp.]|nr:carbohydrate-binding protein [Steroidobacter sp.]
IWRTSDNAYLRIYTTTNVATNRLYTFLHDPQYRVALAWQNVAYNQPPHPSFFVGANMSPPPTPNITIVGGGENPGTQDTYQAENGVLGGGTVTETTNAGYIGSAYVNSSVTGGYLEIQGVDGRGGGSKTLGVRFALGVTSSRTGRLLVNGAAQNITFNPTGAWTTWSTLSIPVTLNNGSNVLRFESTGQDLGNIDQVTVQ